MNRIKPFAALALLLIQLGQASAASLDIVGNYGNEAGCTFAAKQQEAEDMVLLTPREYRTYAALCSFVQIIKASDFTRVVTAICASEGEATQTVELMRIEKDPFGSDAWTIFSAAGDDRGFVTRCR